MAEQRTEIFLVNDLHRALEVAHLLDAEAIALDVEGVLGNYVGNEPYPGRYFDFDHDNTITASLDIANHPNVSYGLVTNNTNTPEPVRDGLSETQGLVARVAGFLDVPYIHKGMLVAGRPLKGKPSGELSLHFSELVDVRPRDVVLIDDQGVKNAGEAAKAGLRAIVVPEPIGLPGRRGGVIEYKGVMLARRFEPAIYRSLGRKGALARFAYRRLAGISINQITNFEDSREPLH